MAALAHIALMLAGSWSLTKAQVSPISCTAGTFAKCGSASVACHFNEDLSKSKKNFNIVHYPFIKTGSNSDSGTYVLVCNWNQAQDAKLECKTETGFYFDQQVSDRLTLAIPDVRANVGGIYVCQVVPDGGVPVETCRLSVEDAPPPVSCPQVTCVGTDVIIAVLILVIILLIFVFIFTLLYLRKRYEITSKPDNPEADKCTCFGKVYAVQPKRRSHTTVAIGESSEAVMYVNNEAKKEKLLGVGATPETKPLLSAGKTDNSVTAGGAKAAEAGGTEGGGAPATAAVATPLSSPPQAKAAPPRDPSGIRTGENTGEVRLREDADKGRQLPREHADSGRRNEDADKIRRGKVSDDWSPPPPHADVSRKRQDPEHSPPPRDRGDERDQQRSSPPKGAQGGYTVKGASLSREDVTREPPQRQALKALGYGLWNNDQVCRWMRQEKIKEEIIEIFQNNGIKGDDLLKMDKKKLNELKVLEVKEVLSHIATLRKNAANEGKDKKKAEDAEAKRKKAEEKAKKKEEKNTKKSEEKSKN